MPTPTRVLDRQTQLHEDGRIRLGHKVKGTTKEGKEYERPAMLDKFRLTSSSRANLEAAALVYGGKVTAWDGHPGQYELYTERDEVRVAVSSTHSLSQAYELWSGGGCVRRCDGEECHFIKTKGKGKDLVIEDEGDAPCMCDKEVREAGTDPKGTCAFTTRLSVMLSELPTLGRWRLETKGKMAGDEIPEILDMLGNLGFGSGPVFCLLTLTQKEIKKIGQPAQRFVVPVLSLDPNPPSMVALIQSVQRSAFTPLPSPEAVPVLNGNTAHSLPATGGTSAPKRTPMEGAALFLAKVGIADEDSLRDLKSFVDGEGKEFVKSCALAKTLGATTKAEVYEAIQSGTIARIEGAGTREGLGL